MFKGPKTANHQAITPDPPPPSNSKWCPKFLVPAVLWNVYRNSLHPSV